MKQFPAARPSIDEADVAAVAQQLRSGRLEEGEAVRRFEAEAAALIGQDHGQATTNGFSAIHVLLLALGIGAGDEVVIPSYCCPAILYPIRLCGAVPVFADLGENSLNMDAEAVDAVASSRTKAILFPYQFGFPADIDAIADALPRLILIEDIAQCFGGRRRGKRLGSTARHAIASFYASKMITAGDGGMVLTRDEEIREIMRPLVYYGGRRGRIDTAHNYHMTNLNAALGLSQLRKVDDFIARRQSLARLYDEILAADERLHFAFRDKEEASFLRYPILLPDESARDRLKTRLAEKGVATGYGVLEALHRKEGVDSRLPRTEAFADRILCLPVYPSLGDDDVRHIAETVLRALKGVI